MVDFCLLLFVYLVHALLRLPSVHDGHVQVTDDKLDWLNVTYRRIHLRWFDLVQLDFEAIDQLLTIDEQLELDVLSIECFCLQLNRLVADVEVVCIEDELLGS